MITQLLLILNTFSRAEAWSRGEETAEVIQVNLLQLLMSVEPCEVVPQLAGSNRDHESRLEDIRMQNPKGTISQVCGDHSRSIPTFRQFDAQLGCTSPVRHTEIGVQLTIASPAAHPGPL